tara:strand:- start:7320 stop:8690 length:1371 start_codon:yes stop_codon:yes gene_type:complete
MIETYYFDCPIKYDKIKDYAVSTRYSDIRIGNKTIQENMMVLNEPQELKVIDDLSKLKVGSVTDEILIFCSSVYSKDLSMLANFLKFASFSMINTFWGHKECFIYKGQRNPLVSYLMQNEKRNIYFVKFPEFVLDLSSLPQLKSLLSNSHDSRHFNEIKSVGDLYFKKSSNAIKLKSEYEFLKNVPDHLKKYFVEVFEFKQEVGYAQYSMVSYDYKDVSHLYLSNSLDAASFKILMSLIEKYFNDAKKTIDLQYQKNSFEDLVQKNTSRLNELKKIAYYEPLNSFLIHFKGISISNHHARIEKRLKEYEKTFNKADYIFSHGDLCFSNILFSPDDLEIKLIDPKGYENNGMRSPYYDMAKLSHSIFGYYDLIINNMVKMGFDDEMQAFLDFSKHDYLKEFDFKFAKLVSKVKLDMTLIRLIEASFFLSMIPFHYENKRKAFMLCLRSVEIYEDISF